MIGIALSIDQSCAFDSLCHNTMRRKLVKYKFGENAVKWIMSYLEFRSFYVEIGTKPSSIKTC